MPDFSHLAKGDRLKTTADAWNEILDTARDHRADRGHSGPPGPLGSIGIPGLEFLIVNTTGANIPLGGPIRLDVESYTIDIAFGRRPVYLGVKPTGNANDVIVIAAEPIPGYAVANEANGTGNGVGRVVVIGHAVTEVAVSNTSHRFAAAAANDTLRLHSNATTGFPILGNVTGTGNLTLGVLVDRTGGNVTISGNGSVPDANHTTSGQVNLSNQYLGAGSKTVDLLRTAGGNTSGSPVTFSQVSSTGYSAELQLISLNSTGNSAFGTTFTDHGLPGAGLWVRADCTGTPFLSQVRFFFGVGNTSANGAGVGSWIVSYDSTLLGIRTHFDGTVNASHTYAIQGLNGNSPGVEVPIGPGATVRGGIILNRGNGSYGTGNGSVTSVNGTTSIGGLSITGGPITGSGTLTLTLTSASSFRTAIGLGNIATANTTDYYTKSEVDDLLSALETRITDLENALSALIASTTTVNSINSINFGGESYDSTPITVIIPP